MKQVLDKQKVQPAGLTSGGASTSKLENLTKESNVVYVDFAKKQVDELQKLNKTLGDTLGDKGELSKTLKDIKSTIKTGAITEKVMGMKPAGIAGDLAPKTGMKDFFTARGFLDKTGILKRGHDKTYLGGLADKALGAREQKGLKAEAEQKDYTERKQQYVADRMATKGTTFGSEASFEKAFDASEKLQKEIVQNEQAIKGLQERGFKEGQIKRGGFFNKQEELEGKLGKVDTRFSGSFGGVKEADPEKPKVVKAADVADPNSTKKRAKVVKEAANDDSMAAPSGLGAADMTEADIENQKLMQEQTELLRAIAENTGGARKPNDAQKPKEAGGGSGLLDGLMSMLGTGILNAAKFLFNPKNLLKAFTKFLLPAMIIGSLVNGIIDGFKAFMDTGSIAEALIAGFGGILSFLTFGLIDAETIRSITNWFSGFVDDFIINPIKNFFGFIGDSFEKYIAKPIMDAFTLVGDLLNEYIVEPIKKFFAPLVDFFKKIKDQVFGFLEDFGIPEVGFTIPIINKKVSIGPFYPFRPEAGTDKVSSDVQMDSKSTSDGGASTNLKQNIGVTNKDETTVLNQESKESVDKDGKINASYSTTMATFDPRTGKASYTSEDDPNNLKYNAPLTKGGFRDIKKASAEGAGSDKIKEIIKEDEAYQKLGFFDKLKVDTGFAKATDLAKLKPPEEPQTGNKVAAQSADSEMAKNAPVSQSSTVIAPMSSVSNNTSSTYAIKPPVRNPNQGVQNQMQKRYGT